MSNGLPIPPVPQFSLAVEPQQGGIKVTAVSPFMFNQIIIPEEHIPRFLASVKKAQEEIPKIVQPNLINPG